jgi:thioredoxin-like negative regulator of GroEL
LTNPISKIDTREELAKVAGVSTGQYTKARTVLNSDNEEIKQKALSGEKKKLEAKANANRSLNGGDKKSELANLPTPIDIRNLETC